MNAKLVSEFKQIKTLIAAGRPYWRILRSFESGIADLERDAHRYRTLRDALESPRWYRISKLGRYVELQRTDIGWGVPNGKGGWYRTLDEAVEAFSLEREEPD